MPADRRPDLLALADRVEREPPSRELDALVHRATHPEFSGTLVDRSNGYLVGGHHPQPVKAPRYTSSIDDAASLLSRRHSYELTVDAADKGAIRRARARVWAWWRNTSVIDPGNHRRTPYGTTPAAALTAAWLRALASEAAHG